MFPSSTQETTVTLVGITVNCTNGISVFLPFAKLVAFIDICKKSWGHLVEGLKEACLPTLRKASVQGQFGLLKPKYQFGEGELVQGSVH